LEPSGDAVKEPKAAPVRLAEAHGFARLFEGWQNGAIVVGLALSAALLAVPRAAPPGIFPVPLVDVVEQDAARARQSTLADHAERAGLPFETRAVGDAVRRLGTAIATSGDTEHEIRLLTERVAAARAAGQLPQLAELCAVQTRLFVRAVREASRVRLVTPELAALGGDFATRGHAGGWYDERGDCIATDDELATLFRLRWLELTKLRDAEPLKPRLGELRTYYRFLLLHPEGGGDVAARNRARLRYVAALQRRDPEYPAHLARGALFGALGMNAESSAALGQHLEESGRATWTLRARNYLLDVSMGEEDVAP
jgi:hypothetical protein